MFKKMINRMGSVLGLNPGRDAPEPVYRILSDGLAVTATKAEAWFVLGTSNTDLMSDEELDRELDLVVKGVGAVVKDTWCHLKIMWTVHTGADYTASMEGYYSAGNWQEWLALRAAHIDMMAPPRRVLLLGVTLTDEVNHDTTALEQLAAPVTGVEQHRVSRNDYAVYSGRLSKLARQLGSTRLRARPAPVETIAWAISREGYGYETPVPESGIVAGATLKELTRGRIVPYPDHLAVYDRTGAIASYRQIMPVPVVPQELEVPGDGNWLHTLGEATRITDDGDEVPVLAEASVRFKVLSRRESLKLAEDARTQAKEQRYSAAKHSAGEPAIEILESEEIAEGLKPEIRRDGTIFVRYHPRLIVNGRDLDELRANADTITSYYADRGITVVPGADEQRELWLETLPGDQLRVEDLGQISDGYGFFNSLFWGGSTLGVNRGPSIGQITGHTSGLARIDMNFAKRGLPTSVGIFGNSGQGKTTLMELLCLEVGFAGGWAMMWDWKGDTKGMVNVARHFQIPSALMRFGPEHAGAVDLFRALPIAEAPLQVARQLALLAPSKHKDYAETAALAATNEVAKSPEPSTWKVIQLLVNHEEPTFRELGRALVEMSETSIGRVLLAEPSGKSLLTSDPGIWVLQMPGMTPPSSNLAPEQWDITQRLSLAAQRAVTTYGLHVSSSQKLRALQKLIAIPELHFVLRTADGVDFIETTARTGRAFGTGLLMDSQDITGVESVPGIAEQLVSVFGFKLTTSTQQDSQATFLGMDANEWTRDIIGSLGPSINNEFDRNDTSEDDTVSTLKGDCFYRDTTDQLAHIKVDLPAPWIQAMLDTAPKEEQPDDEENSDEGAAA